MNFAAIVSPSALAAMVVLTAAFSVAVILKWDLLQRRLSVVALLLSVLSFVMMIAVGYQSKAMLHEIQNRLAEVESERQINLSPTQSETSQR